MIRTHKPIGNFWTCPSSFQQTKEFRSLEGALSPPHSPEVLVGDVDDGLSDDERAKKRRRVETLVEQFFEGRQLLISSAVAGGPSLRESVAGVLKERDLPFKDCTPLGSSLDTWEDISDGWISLREAPSAKCTSLATRPTYQVNKRSVGNGEAPIAGSTLQPPRLSNTNSIPRPLPSKFALAKALDLRNGGWRQPAAFEVPAEALETLHEAAEVESLASLPQSHSVQQSNEHRRRIRVRKPLPPKTPEDDTLVDELRCSRTETPSCRPRAMDKVSFESVTVTSVSESAASTFASASHVRGSSRKPYWIFEDVEQLDGTVLDEGAAELVEEDAHMQEAPTILYQRNDGLSKRVTQDSIAARDELVRPEDLDTQNWIKNTERGESSRRVWPAVNTATPVTVKGKGIHLRTRRREEHMSEKSAQGNLTPFKYRKKDTRSLSAHAREACTPEALAQQRAPESEKPKQDNEVDQSNQEISHLALKARADKPASPMVHHSFPDNSPPLKNVNTPLVDQHLNRVLPTSPESKRASSSIKRAPRRELRVSGAEITRVEREPSSPQVGEDEVARGTASEGGATATYRTADSDHVRLPEAPEQVWPGTQVLIAQANDALFTSPAMSMSPGTARYTPAAGPGCSVPDSGGLVDTPVRPRRTRLSGDNLPATQALIAGWSPWSTVKPSRTGKTQRTTIPIPSRSADRASSRLGALAAARGSDGLASDANIDKSRAAARTGRSSLRFSITAVESPVGAAEISTSLSDCEATTTLGGSTASPSTMKRASRTGSSKEGRVHVETASVDGTPLLAMGPEHSSSQAAQSRSPMALTEESDPERTGIDVAQEVFGSSRDLNG